MVIRGIGIVSVTISEMARICENGRIARMFTASEMASARVVAVPAEYLAARFAAKEAVFKAVAHLLDEKSFDLRLVETLGRDDGSPYVNADGPLHAILAGQAWQTSLFPSPPRGTLRPRSSLQRDEPSYLQGKHFKEDIP